MFRDEKEALRELEEQLLQEEDTQPLPLEEYPQEELAEEPEQGYAQPAHEAMYFEQEQCEDDQYDEPEEKDRSGLVAVLVVLLTQLLKVVEGRLNK